MPKLLPRLAMISALTPMGCAPPAVTQDGQLVFTEEEQRGATVITANGVEFMDRDEVPAPRPRKSAYEPWQPPTGFLLPADGVLRATSRPVALRARGMAVVLRTSDALVPSWGGELLLRFDVLVPPAAHKERAASLRKPLRLVIVLDDDGLGSVPLADIVIDALGNRDRVAIIDSTRAQRELLPPVPGTHHSLASGVVRRALERRTKGRRRPRQLGAALALAGRLAAGRGQGHILVLSDGIGVGADRGRVARELAQLRRRKVDVLAVGAHAGVARQALEVFGDDAATGDGKTRRAALRDAITPPGAAVLKDVALSFSAAPAPVRLLEASGGRVWHDLEHDGVELGELSVGEARSEVVRLGVPEWVAGEDWLLTVTATHTDAAGRRFRSRRKLRMTYSDAVERIAYQRHGDVLAYASALAWVRRLEHAFIGDDLARMGGMAGLLSWQARSLRVLAKERKDPALSRQAEVLSTLVHALDEG